MAKMNKMMRREMERNIIECAVRGLLAAGFSLAVDYDDDTTPPISDEFAFTMGRFFACSEETLEVFRKDSMGYKPAGFVRFVYGNSGWDVMNNWSVTLEPHLADALALTDNYSNRRLG